MGFGIGAFLAPQHLRRQHILHRRPQQSLFIAVPVLVFPRHIVQILGNAVVAERHTHLQGIVHTHPVLPIQQSLHEPVQIQFHHFPHPGFQRRILRQLFCGTDGAFIGILDIRLGVDLFRQLRTEELCPIGGTLRPGETVDPAHICIPVPGIAAEQFVSTFAGKRHGDFLSDLAAEQQQGTVHVHHARQVSGIHGGIKRLCQRRRIQHRPVMLTAQIALHGTDIGGVAGGLEMALLEIAVVVPVVHGKGVEHFSTFPENLAGQGREQAGIQTAG